jgi:hypothetical protein
MEVVRSWYDDDKPNDVVVFGRSYTPEYDNDGIKTNVYKSQEINDKLARQTVGLPVYIEHDDRYPVGWVADSFVDELRTLNSFLYITGNRTVNEKILDGALAIDPMTNKRYYSGLSMGTRVELDTESRPYVFAKGAHPKEISIVQEPDRPNAHIFDYWVVPRHNEEPKEFVNEISRHYDRFF